MQINLKLTQIEMTDRLSAYLREKEEALERLLGTEAVEAQAQIELGRESKHHRHGEIFRAEINLHLPTVVFRAVGRGPDLFSALDAMRDEVIREVVTHRRRQKTLLRRGGRAVKNFLRSFRN